jgi:hypothetical protein
LIEPLHPVKGLKTIATAEVAEKYFERAKDATELYRAVETKLSEQRKFVLWWDAQEKQEGARGIGKKVALQIGNATLGDRALVTATKAAQALRIKAPEIKFFIPSDSDALQTCIDEDNRRPGKIPWSEHDDGVWGQILTTFFQRFTVAQPHVFADQPGS